MRSSGERPWNRSEVASTNVARNWHVELLQARLRKVDDALDRLMSGSYGDCVKCGRWVEDTKLDFDPAIAFCVECWQRLQLTTGRLISTKSEPEEIQTSDSLDNLMKITPVLPGMALESLAPLIRFRFVRSTATIGSSYLIPALVVPWWMVAAFPSRLKRLFMARTLAVPLLRQDGLESVCESRCGRKNQLVSTSPVQSFYVERHTGAQNTMASAAQSQEH